MRFLTEITFAQDVDHVGYKMPRLGCELVMKTLGENKQARILDAASGTGLGGKLVSDVSLAALCGGSSERFNFTLVKMHCTYLHHCEIYML